MTNTHAPRQANMTQPKVATKFSDVVTCNSDAAFPAVEIHTRVQILKTGTITYVDNLALQAAIESAVANYIQLNGGAA